MNPIRYLFKRISQTVYDLSGRVDQDFPDQRKVLTIYEYAKQYPHCKTFIETGTYFGATPLSLKDIFYKIYTIELDPWLYKKARARLSPYPKIHCLLGDSAKVLPALLLSINEPVIYWLDAHYSRGLTTMGDNETPMFKELFAILSHPFFKDSVILIDDADCLFSNKEYPSMDNIITLMQTAGWEIQITVKDEIVRIVKK
jgi:hypothetical protein